MNSYNSKTEAIKRTDAVQIVPERAEPRLIKSQMFDIDQLSISEDCDPGSDPYNSTGHHVIIKSKLDLQD
jgi:hypothetical protein